MIYITDILLLLFVILTRQTKILISAFQWFCFFSLIFLVMKISISNGYCFFFSSALQSLHNVMFYLVCVVPIFVSAAQALAWRLFSIRNSHTVETKYTDG